MKTNGMDPNKALERIRELVALLREEYGPVLNAADENELFDTIKALDEWIEKGGPLPQDWVVKKALVAEEPPKKTTPRPVYTIADRGPGQRSIWTRIGTAWTNRDGSVTLRLDALPVNGVMQVRDAEPSRDGEPTDDNTRMRAALAGIRDHWLLQAVAKPEERTPNGSIVDDGGINGGDAADALPEVLSLVRVGLGEVEPVVRHLHKSTTGWDVYCGAPRTRDAKATNSLAFATCDACKSAATAVSRG